ncbi:MAG: heme-binding protein [Desulfobacterales bacterium]
MLSAEQVKRIRNQGRYIAPAKPGDEDLGPLKQLPGTWKNLPNLPGRGWNMIALPFATEPDSRLNYRLLVNQYNEELKFTLVDKGVPNRGIRRNGSTSDSDQFLVTLDYEQTIKQIAADDFPNSGKAGGPDLAIHHEPGLWLHMTNETTNNLDIARLATIPHGDSVLALGTSEEISGAPRIPNSNGLPIGVPQDLNNPYLSPYKHFHDNLFQGLFDPTDPNKLLNDANAAVTITKATKLEVDTAVESGGVVNIPFIVKQANAADMKSVFWIQELDETDASGNPKLRLQYTQMVMLDFFPRFDGAPGLIRWPHVSINTMEKVADPPGA